MIVEKDKELKLENDRRKFIASCLGAKVTGGA